MKPKLLLWIIVLWSCSTFLSAQKFTKGKGKPTTTRSKAMKMVPGDFKMIITTQSSFKKTKAPRTTTVAPKTTSKKPMTTTTPPPPTTTPPPSTTTIPPTTTPQPTTTTPPPTTTSTTVTVTQTTTVAPPSTVNTPTPPQTTATSGHVAEPTTVTATAQNIAVATEIPPPTALVQLVETLPTLELPIIETATERVAEAAALISGGHRMAIAMEPELLLAAPVPEEIPLLLEIATPPPLLEIVTTPPLLEIATERVAETAAMISGGHRMAVAMEPEMLVAIRVTEEPQVAIRKAPEAAAMISGGHRTAIMMEPELLLAAPVPEEIPLLLEIETPPPLLEIVTTPPLLEIATERVAETAAMISGGHRMAVAMEPEMLVAVRVTEEPQVAIREAPERAAMISGGHRTAIMMEPELLLAAPVPEEIPLLLEIATTPPLLEIATERVAETAAMISGGHKMAVAMEPEMLVAVRVTEEQQVAIRKEPERAAKISGGHEMAIMMEPELLRAPAIEVISTTEIKKTGVIAGGVALASEPELLLAPVAAAETATSASLMALDGAVNADTAGSTIANLQMARGFQQVTPAMAMAMAAGTNIAAAPTTTTTTTSPAPEVAINIQEIKNLFNTLLTNYDTRIRPRSDQANSVKLHTKFVPNSIIEFDTQEQKFAIMGYFIIEWWDQLLGWTPADYSGADTLKVPASEIWTPALVIGRAFNGKNIIGQSSSDIVLVHWLGYVQWVPEGTYSVVCEVNIQFYPFDIQTCALTYYVSDENSNNVNLTVSDELDLSEFLPNSEWDVLNVTTSTATKNNATHVSVVFTVKRRGEFALFTVIMPLLMLSCLNGFVFLVPIDTGEKGSFAITIFLAYGVFVTIVIDTLPHNSLQVSYFVLYILSLLSLSVFLVFYTILQSKIVMKLGDKPCGLKLPSRKPRAVAPAGDNMIGPQVFTWRMFLKRVDTWMFAVFAVVVVCDTIMFLVSVVEQVSLF